MYIPDFQKMKTTFVLVFISLFSVSLSVRCWVTASNNNSQPVVYNARTPTVSVKQTKYYSICIYKLPDMAFKH
jgi:hypothetical protein